MRVMRKVGSAVSRFVCRCLPVFRSYRSRRVSAALREKAVGCGLCRPWQQRWRDGASVSEMLDMYVEGIDFCIEHDYPGNDVLKKYGGKDLARHGVFVDAVFSAENPGTIVANGHCDGKVRYDGFNVGNLYIRHGSHVAVETRERGQAFIEVYDDAHVRVSNTGRRPCFVYRYGGTVECSGDVRVRDRTGR